MYEKMRRSPIFIGWAKILVLCMTLQGMPLAQLSQAYTWHFEPERLLYILDLLGPASAEAAPPKVVCVPQLPTDLLVPHETWSGEPTVLKGIARDADGNLTGGTYYWELGDGTSTAPAPIVIADNNLAVTHTYAAAPGTLFVARLHVTDAAGETASDDYRVLVKVKTLDVEVNKAIDDGLWYLHRAKESTGAYFRWNNVRYGNHFNNSTASAVQAFEINGHLESGNRDEDPYVDTVRGGIDYLMSQMSSYNIGPQTYGNPDANGNGIGITVSGDRPIYELGAVMDALVASGTPDAKARTGGVNVVGRRYQDIVQDMCDMYAWGQTDQGGWQYGWNSGNDNSASQWAAIGMIAAERLFGCTISQWVKDRNMAWLDASYNSAGFFGYTSRSANSSGYATGPSGMVQLSFDDYDTSDSKWQACVAYIDNQWNNFISLSRDTRYYSYYPFAKAMRLAIPEEVTHLPSGLDWYGDETRGLARILVDRQNADGYWPYDGWPYVGERTAAAWNIIILTRTLFEKPPVALITAEPNPGAVGQSILLDAGESYHVDPAKTIVEYQWDFDAADGVDFNNPDAVGITAEVTYAALGDYQVSLRVMDDSTPARFDVGTLILNITTPPHPPTAVVGSPYIAVVGEEIQLDGSGSYDVDAPQGDEITAWDWEIDFVAPYDFNEASGASVIIPGFGRPGHYDIALRVTDNTAAVFPQSGSPDLTHTAFGRVSVFNTNITDLVARPKLTKCQLTWTHVDSDRYEVLRSEAGPNHGFALIGTTDSTYSVYIDYNVEMTKDYWYRIRCELNGETVLSGPVYVNSQGRIRNQPPAITSTPVTDAQEGQPYSYDVNAVDPEGKALSFILDQAPAGMVIDAATGLITWTPAFADVGVVDVAVRVNDALLASASQFFQITVQPRPNTPPTANPGGPYEGLINTATTFDASASTDPDGDLITLFHWVFGDGREGYGQEVDHTYTAPGTYTVTLYVTDERGATGSAETVCQVEAPNRPPEAVIEGLGIGEMGLPMVFNAFGSSDPDGDSLTYTWNFGDSTPAETGETVVHTYATEGTFTLSLSADDGRGGLDTAVMEIVIGLPNQPPAALFSVTGEPTRLQTLTFDASGSSDPEGQPIAAYQWDFGDGTTTTGQVVTHSYDSVGTFTVVLTVTDDKGTTGATQQEVVIAEVMVPVPDVTGLEQTAAEAAILGADLTVGTITPQASETVPAGLVISQDPAGGESVEIHRAVNLTVSTGMPMVIVPTVTLMARADAEAAIVSADLTVGTITGERSTTVPEGAVIRQSPEGGASAEIHSPVDLAISIGDHQEVIVPDVIGMALADAQTAIAAAGLSTGTVTEQYNSTVPAGHVISSDPMPGATVIDTTPVDLVVSLGVQMTTVPAVVGQDQAAATAAITGAGLVMGIVTNQMDLSVPEGRVLDQNPAGGSSAPVNSAVNLTVAVHSDTIAPQVGIGFSANPVGPGQYTRITVTATDNLGVTQTQLSVDGTEQALDANNQCWYQAGNEGTATVSATARDAAGNIGSASAELVVSSETDANPPSVSMTYSPSAPAVGETITFNISATDDTGVDIERIWLKVDGVYIPVAGGQASYVARRQGNIPAVASAYDLQGNYAQDAQTIPVSASGTSTAPPSATITSPTDEAEVMGIVDVIGTAFDADLAYYTLSYRADGESEFIEYHRSETPVTNGVLGVFDGTLLENGLYTLQLRAYDIYGASTADTVQVYVSGEQKVGNFTLSFTDMKMALSGIDIEVVRTYDSRVKDRRDFGVGWSLAVKQSARLSENVVPGEGWAVYCTRSLFGTCLEWGLQASQDHDVTIQIPGVRKQEFRATVVTTYASPGGISQGYIRFDAKPGTYTSLEPLDNVTFDFMIGGELLDLDFDVINPNRYRLKLLDGTQYYYNQDTGSIYRIVDPNGNSVDIADSGITHSSAAQIQFLRDAQGRITSIQDGSGRTVEYAYDGLGNLISSTDPNGNVTRYKYAANNYLDEIIDPRGIPAVRTEYDEDGRMIRQINPDGDEMVFDHDTDNQRETITDFAGNQTSFVYDDNGKVTAKTDTLGNTWSYAYDARGNLTQTVNPDGTTTSATYDAQDNKLSDTDELGNTTTYTYNASGMMTSQTDPLGRITRFEYDARGNLLRQIGPDGVVISESAYDSRGNVVSETDGLGAVTQYTYDAQGNKLSETDALSNTTAYTYDSRGNLQTQTNARSGVTTYAYDDNGNLLTETDPLGNSVTNTYTSFNKLLTTTDKLGRTTENVYDAFGQHVQTISPDGTSSTMAYDVNGNLVRQTDALGRVTSNTYDGEKRLLSTQYADGSIVRQEYDALGRKTAAVDARGNRTEYEYDAAGRNVLVRDALGNETDYEYDAAGNRIAVVDALGHRTEFEYDEYSRQTAIHHPDGTTTAYGYDNAGNKTSETDQAGISTQFGYDALGRLIRVTDALGGETSYAYDAVGNKISQTDPNGHTTTWAYDGLNRVASRALPGGQSESFTHDAGSNVLTHTDFNGDTTRFAYDEQNRLVRKTFADGTAITFTYTASGQRNTVIDARGTTRYTYDLRDRLLEVIHPDGSVLMYAYDANGNRISLTAPGGRTDYSFDALNRLSTATDPDGGVTSYQYDDVGNRLAATYPNGTVTSYAYNSLNRLTYLENRKSTGGIISSYTYTLGPAGNRIRVVEQSGRTVNYSYDTLYRLVEEEIVDAALGNKNISYTYDGFGNRLTKTDGSGVTSYTYDSNDRLITETGPSGTLNYTYDDNGNTLSKTDGADTTDYSYDYENRLIGAQSSASTIGYAYDLDGIRTQSIVDGAITNYVVDKNRDYAQVIEERNGSGGLIVSYVYGDDLIRQQRGSVDRLYLYDGQMSTRQLIDSGENITDEYNFDAFGIIIDKVGITANNYLYTGEQYDPNVGFYYLRARFYNQGIGRFITRDLLQGSAFEPLTLHRYLYTKSDPTNNWDPSGNYTLASSLSGMAIISTLASISIPKLLGFLAGVISALVVAKYLTTITYPALENYLRTQPMERALEKARDIAKTKVERATRRQLKNILYHYTDKFAALSILASQSMYLTRAWRDPRTGTHLPQGAYATDIAPWAPMTQRELAEIFYFSPRRQSSADLSWFVVIVNDIAPYFVPVGGSQWVKPDGTVHAVLAWKNPMP